MGVWYTTRETVKSALDIKLTARVDSQIDDAIEQGSRMVESCLHRRFYPETATRYFNWPNGQYARPWRLWLDQHELISVTSLVSGGTTISASDYFLEPVNDGPPYSHVEIDLDSTASFGGGSTHQRDIAITGVFGYKADTSSAGALAEALDSSETGIDVTNSGIVGVGSILLVESERMLVTNKSMLDTTQDIGGNLTADKSNTTVPVTTGSDYFVNEVILVDSERMLIVDISGNNLTVIRAWDGSVLASHSSGADIYAPRTLTVQRGALGTTAASHDTATAVSKYLIPGPVASLAKAYAINQFMQETAGYAKVGSGETERDYGGRSLKALEESVIKSHGRKARIRAV